MSLPRLVFATLFAAFWTALVPAAATDLIAPGAVVTKAAGGFQFTEGPAANRAGEVFFTDGRQKTIFKYALDGQVSVFRDHLAGCNGLMFDPQDRLFVCQTTGGRAITMITPDGTESPVVSSYEGKKLNSPNDLWLDARGGIYFSDPRYGKRDNMELDGEYVFYLPPDRGPLVKVADGFVRPNGVIGSRDGKTLYIGDHIGKKTWAYDIQPDGSLANRRLFAPAGADGVGVDERGNVYLVTDTVEIWSPAGVLLEKIAVPEAPTNVTWGGADRKTLFITAQTSLYTLKMTVTGY